jgi:hypothetical protein
LSLFANRFSGGESDYTSAQKVRRQGELGLHSQMKLPVSGMYPEYVIQQSSNLVNWITVAGPIAGSVGVSDEFMRVAVPTAEAVGNVQLMMIAVDNGPGDLAVYGGPILSHYEFELGPTTRLTDGEWKSQVANNIIPPAPDWTKSYLVPKP